MDIIHDMVIPCLCSFIACAALGVQFNIRFRHLIAASVGSLVSQFIFILLEQNSFRDVVCCFVSAAAVALFSEIMAKVNKAPVNMYLIIGIIPLVPGGLAYYSMLALVMGDKDTFLDRAVDAFAEAGAIAPRLQRRPLPALRPCASSASPRRSPGAFCACPSLLPPVRADAGNGARVWPTGDRAASGSARRASRSQAPPPESQPRS